MVSLGKPVTVFGSYTGAILKEMQDSCLVSFYADGENLCREVPRSEISVGGELLETKEYTIEKEDEGCEGGACKI